MPQRSFASNAASGGHARRLARPVQAFDGWCCRCISSAPLPRARVDSRAAVRMLGARLVVLASFYLRYNTADVHALACTPSTDAQLVAPLFHFSSPLPPAHVDSRVAVKMLGDTSTCSRTVWKWACPLLLGGRRGVGGTLRGPDIPSPSVKRCRRTRVGLHTLYRCSTGGAAVPFPFTASPSSRRLEGGREDAGRDVSV